MPSTTVLIALQVAPAAGFESRRSYDRPPRGGVRVRFTCAKLWLLRKSAVRKRRDGRECKVAGCGCRESR